MSGALFSVFGLFFFFLLSLVLNNLMIMFLGGVFFIFVWVCVCGSLNVLDPWVYIFHPIWKFFRQYFFYTFFLHPSFFGGSNYTYIRPLQVSHIPLKFYLLIYVFLFHFKSFLLPSLSSFIFYSLIPDLTLIPSSVFFILDIVAFLSLEISFGSF